MKKNPIAWAVKLADLEHNMDLGRLDEVNDYAIKRVEKYCSARESPLIPCPYPTIFETKMARH